jgi:SAM-dependent methyltransferase
MFSQANAYERFMGRWSRLLAPRFIEFSEVGEGGAVLDVGCGTGALSCAIRDRTKTARITGVDTSQDYVTHASNSCTDSRVRFQVGDARELPFPDAEFDRTMSMLVLNFVSDAERAVKEWTRVTKPSGLVAAAVWDYGEGMEMLRVFWDEATALDPALTPREEARMPLCKRGELATLFERVGLTDVVEEPLAVAMRFDSFDDYWAPFLLGQGPAGACVADLPPHDREKLRDRLHRRMLGSAPDHPIELQGRAWAVKGRVG